MPVSAEISRIMEAPQSLPANARRGLRAVLADHWPEYLIEGAALGLFMISAGLFTTLFEYPGSPVHQAITDPTIRRILIGIAMGLTAIGIIYSPWGQRSGAHMNPAMTLTFWSFGKVRGYDALGYMAAQFVGGALGVLIVIALLGDRFAAPPVQFATTTPGEAGPTGAFAAEFAISAALVFTVLWVSNTNRVARLTGLIAGILVAIYISIEAPISGMSMNPARSLASALPAALWEHLWIYFVAPPAGMLTGAFAYRAWRTAPRIDCAKLDHAPTQRCIHCGYVPLAAALRNRRKEGL
jgi:aquaporin Z